MNIPFMRVKKKKKFQVSFAQLISFPSGALNFPTQYPVFAVFKSSL